MVRFSITLILWVKTQPHLRLSQLVRRPLAHLLQERLPLLLHLLQLRLQLPDLGDIAGGLAHRIQPF